MLRKLALYWDGQWFLKTVDEFGLEAGVRMNARVRASFGRIEMRLMLKALDKRQADSLVDAMEIVGLYGQVLMGGALQAEPLAVTPERAELVVRRCAAYEGARLAGLARSDQACVACELLWGAWLETLLPGQPVEVVYPMRQGKDDPHCHFIFTLVGPEAGR
ncbi:MAG: hypothetical protein GX605_12035 [Chloroflexi bacterium]|nr:hypothetical protein [Chloroflexota bacterium]